MSSTPHIVVIGAGVIGLTTATLLAEAGYRVTVLAAQLPGDQDISYASPWAGAHWRTHASANDPEQCDWDVQTYQHWIEVLQREADDATLPRSGVKMFDSLHFWDGEIAADDLWWAPYVQEFAQLSMADSAVLDIGRRQRADSPRITQGARCRAMAVNVPHYLKYLQNEAQKRNVVLHRATLPTLHGLAGALHAAENVVSSHLGLGKIDCYVNATGLGARALCHDDAVYPVRGQTVLVKGEAKAIRTRYGLDASYMSYCIPRPGSGTTILGGTREAHVWQATPDPAATQVILERASSMVPELLTAADGAGGFEVLSVQCGLRPARTGGPRTAREIVAGRNVVHSYGFAGAGYQNSIGAARLAVRHVGEFVKLGASPRADGTARL